MSARGKVRTYSWAQVQDHYRTMIEDPQGSGESSLVPQLLDGNYWAGCDTTEVLDRLDRGYDFPEDMRVDFPELTSEGVGNRWRWSDEDGDYDHAEFLSGEPDYMLDRKPSAMRPGVYVHAGMWFHAGTPSEVIAEYGCWVGGAVASIQATGCDVSLRVESTAQRIYEGEDLSTVAIQVKRFGEQLVARDFAALFAEGGMRHLIFGSYSLAERAGEATVNTTYGHARYGLGWVCEFDPDTRTLTIEQPASASHFPAEELNAQLAEIRERL